ncbi:MAG: AraC family ligand binding domain-containing protein [Desulfotignum sp.]|nr:AraC family ligand binding domain-containing protein [Desulfotignum sp.]
MHREFREYISIRHLNNLEALNALFYKHTFGRHFHEAYAIGIILNGSETYECNQKTIVAPRGSIVIVNPGEIHNGHASDVEDGWRYFMIYPKLSMIKKVLHQMDLDTERLP